MSYLSTLAELFYLLFYTLSSQYVSLIIYQAEWNKVLMSLQDQYIQAVIRSLSPYQKHQFRDGTGYKVACPFCRDAQKNDSKSNEKCAVIYPVPQSFSYFFSCNRGLNGGKGNQRCSYTMKLSTFLKQLNPPLYRKYIREKEVVRRFYCGQP